MSEWRAGLGDGVCSYCKGSGEDEYGNTCWSCKGDGKCSSCNGTGKSSSGGWCDSCNIPGSFRPSP